MKNRTAVFFSASILCFFLLHAVSLRGDTLKTTRKRYTIRSYEKSSILCEPYGVKKDDWLYKIFRKKGAISKKDFPLFLTIFKTFNPQISNIDTIKPGQEILIPLKVVQPEDYQEDEPGIVHVPVLEFSSPPDILAPYMKQHNLSINEPISRRLDPVFLNSDGTLNAQGKKALALMNPGLTISEVMTSGGIINLPDPSILSQPWFCAMFPDAPPPGKAELPEKRLTPSQLNRYAALIGGRAHQRGRYHFPRPGGGEALLDLETTPMIRLNTGERILIGGRGQPEPSLLSLIKPHWPDLTVLDMSRAKEEFSLLKGNEFQKISPHPSGLSSNPEILAKVLLKKFEFKYLPGESIPFLMAGLHLEAVLGRVILKNRQDLLLNFGNVQGFALDILRKQGFTICTLFPGTPPLETARMLFDSLGANPAWDPVFVSPKTHRTVTIPGLYITLDNHRLLVASKEEKIDDEALNFLDKKGIDIITLPSPE